jgi:AcrR family transcriptional regulator
MGSNENGQSVNKRKPAQERGEQRIRQILDAAARIIAASKPLTIQSLSKEAHTSIGSLYHFFPDLPSVILALSERHFRNIKKMVGELTPEEWINGDTEDFINHLFSPYVRYMIDNPDYILVLKLQGFTFDKSQFLDYMMNVIRSRYPDWATGKVKRETEFLHIMATGILQQSFQRDKALAYKCIPRIICILELYLKHLEYSPSQEKT